MSTTLQELYADLTPEILAITANISKAKAKELLKKTKVDCDLIVKLNQPWAAPVKQMPTLYGRTIFYGRKQWRVPNSQPYVEAGLDPLMEDLFSTANIHILGKQSPWYDPSYPLANMELSRYIYGKLKKLFGNDYEYFDEKYRDNSPPSSKRSDLSPRLAEALERKLRGDFKIPD